MAALTDPDALTSFLTHVGLRSLSSSTAHQGAARSLQRPFDFRQSEYDS